MPRHARLGREGASEREGGREGRRSQQLAAPRARRRAQQAARRAASGRCRPALALATRGIVVLARHRLTVLGILRPTGNVCGRAHVCTEPPRVHHDVALTAGGGVQPRWHRHQRPRHVLTLGRFLLEVAQLHHGPESCTRAVRARDINEQSPPQLVRMRREAGGPGPHILRTASHRSSRLSNVSLQPPAASGPQAVVPQATNVRARLHAPRFRRRPCRTAPLLVT